MTVNIPSIDALAGLLFVCVMVYPVLAAEQRASVPSFAPDSDTAWVPDRPAGDEFLPPPSGLGPVVSEKGHPYTPNGQGQSTFRVAGLSNPILKPWAIAQMRKD